MGKKKNIDNIYETDQANKKHRKKNKKLVKREKYKKDKKKLKKTKHEKRKLHKYIIMSFKENQKELDFGRLPLDIDEVVKNVNKLISLNESSIKEVPELFRLMEENKKEINLSGMEDLSAQKYISKLFKNFKLSQNPKNPYKFKIKEYNIDSKARYTTDEDYVIRQCISSFYLFLKAIFEFQNFKLKSQDEDAAEKSNKEEADDSASEASQDSQSSNSEDDNNSSCNSNSNSIGKAASRGKNKAKQNRELEKIKYEMDYENHLLEEKFGGNAELLNKAFHKIMNDDQLFKNDKSIIIVFLLVVIFNNKISLKKLTFASYVVLFFIRFIIIIILSTYSLFQFMLFDFYYMLNFCIINYYYILVPDSILEGEKDKSEQETKTNQHNNIDSVLHEKEPEMPRRVMLPAVPDFLASTMRLLENSNNDDESNLEAAVNTKKPENSLDELLNNISYKKDRVNINQRNFNKNKIVLNSAKIEPLNKDSYNRILQEERQLKKLMESQLEDYESKYRSTSLLELHQQKLANEKAKRGNNSSNLRLQSFDREKVLNVGKVDSKRAIAIMQDKNGLKGRFEQKEKYIGY